MIITHNEKHFNELRKEFPFFVFENYSIKYTNLNICITYHFNLSDKISFYPSLEIPFNKEINKDKLSDALLNNIVFHIGLIELLSYWKAACSPEIIIKPFKLNENQLQWWKNLYFNGLGEFFYLNGINPDINNFVTIRSVGKEHLEKQKIELKDANIIPMGGGKDSAVTFELMSEAGQDNLIFFLNPQHIPVNVINVQNRNNLIVTAKREISHELLELNKKGFLNGHTPFSALLAFTSLLISALTWRKNIVLSNESSANESTVANTTINHQYSKTIAFERDFRKYVKEYISEDFNYFSFLRPVNELQIAFLFSGYNHFFDKFRSCNAGSKSGVWCCKCPKCLFTYIILSPFLSEVELIHIFGEDLFAKKAFQGVFDQLTGKAAVKPFDCIGTIDEVNAALVLCIEKYNGEDLPYLLSYYFTDDLYKEHKKKDSKTLLRQFNKENFLSDAHSDIIKKALNKRFMSVYNEKMP